MDTKDYNNCNLEADDESSIHKEDTYFRRQRQLVVNLESEISTVVPNKLLHPDLEFYNQLRCGRHHGGRGRRYRIFILKRQVNKLSTNMNKMFSRMNRGGLYGGEGSNASDSNVVNSNSNSSRNRSRDDLEKGNLRHTPDER